MARTLIVALSALSILSVPACFAATTQKEKPSPTFSASVELPGAKAAMLPTVAPSSHASNLLLLRNGDVLCFWFSGSEEGQGGVGIVVSRLKKGSMTWEPTQVVDRDPKKSYQNPVPFEAPDGTIWLLHTQQSAGKGQADAQVLKVLSHDGGKTWTSPSILFGKLGAYDRQPIVIGKNGEWLFPMYYSTAAGITNGAETNYSTIASSTDQGRNWKETLVPHSEGLVQMSIVKLGASRFVAFFRSRYADFIYRSESTDGIHWSAPSPTVLPNNNASIQAAALADGAIVMAFDNTRGPKAEKVPQTGPRVPLSLALSSDGGITWKYVRDLEVPASVKVRDASKGVPAINLPNSEEYSYPSVLQLPDGSILATYTYRREAIKAVRVSEEWIRQGKTVGVYQPAKAK